MKLIVGLGNPGEKYVRNRHNAGFMFVDYLMAKWLNGCIVKKEKNYITIQPFNHSDLMLAKPQTFMNNSGQAVRELIKNLNLPAGKAGLKIKNFVVVHDDLDIPLGKFKIQVGTGPKLHNGVESIENHLHTKDFLRVRIGVDARTKDYWPDGETYALSDFKKEEKEILLQLFPEVWKSLSVLL